jgi:membrane-associated phospholipid phosphatase
LEKLIYILKSNPKTFINSMKARLITLLFSLLVLMGNAQSKDTIAAIKNQDKISYKQFIAPVTLLTAGTLLLNTNLNDNLQSNANNFFGENFHTTADNYLLFVPVVQIYLGKSFGFKPKNDFQHQTINIAIANVMAVSATEVLKRSVKEERPDQSDDLSFPSGHTTVAFTNAALLYYEYKDSNLWYASSGFLFATATGILRIANNRHYTSDVLAGAGIGLASGLIVSYWNPLKSMTFGKKKKTTAFVYPQIGSQIGMGALIQLN